MKKVCVITAARSEYGLLRWVIDEIHKDESLQLQLIVTGSHLSQDFGFTYHFIEEDGYKIDEKIDMQLQIGNVYSIPRSMGLCAEGMGYAFQRLRPDIIVILGDRYELLPIANTALLLRIPIAHISGGDITEGAIDNEIRNAISMVSTLHFPGTEDSKKRLSRMLGTTRNIFLVGEPGLDSFFKYELMTRKELALNLGLDENKKWMLVTLHSETKQSLAYNAAMVCGLYAAMKLEIDTQFVVTKANADIGGDLINTFWDAVHSENVYVFPSLGQKRYLSLMQQVVCVLGNSSSGIVEAPFLGIPVVNIGNRQKGRHVCRNVINCGIAQNVITEAIRHIKQYRCKDTFWGDGKASERIVEYIKNFLYEKE